MDAIVTQPALSVTPTTLAEARSAYVSVVGSEYGAGKIYAQFLLNEFGEEWIDAKHDAPGATMDAFRAERALFYTDLKAVGHSNPSVKLKQIKDHARSIIAAAAKQMQDDGLISGEAAEGESTGNKRENRSVQVRMIEELLALYKFCKKQVLDEKQAASYRSIGQALRDLGVNTDNIA